MWYNSYWLFLNEMSNCINADISIPMCMLSSFSHGWLFCNPMDCRPPGSSVHGILQARILEWLAMPSSRGSSQPRDWIQVSWIAGGFFTVWATREAQEHFYGLNLYPFRCVSWSSSSSSSFLRESCSMVMCSSTWKSNTGTEMDDENAEHNGLWSLLLRIW